MTENFEEVLKIKKLMTGFKKPWFIAGGWAIDLFIGHPTREHQDIEIAIFRKDQRAIRSHLIGWELRKVIPKKGQIYPRELWAEDEWLELPIHQIEAQRIGSDRDPLEILLNESSGELWRFRRNMEITRPIERIGMRSEDGIPFIAPEIALLYKAKAPSIKRNEDDFYRAVDLLGEERRLWLKKAIEICHPEHHWLESL